MKTITINGHELKSAESLESTLNYLNLQASYKYGSLFAFVLKLDFKAKTYTLTLPSDNEEQLPIAWIGNYLTNDRDEYTALTIEQALDNAINKLQNDGLELRDNSISYILNPCDYRAFSDKSLLQNRKE